MSLFSFLKRTPPTFERAVKLNSLVHVVIDVQKEFCDPLYTTFRGTKHTDEIAQRINGVSKNLRALNIPTVIVYSTPFNGRSIKTSRGGLHHLEVSKDDLLAYKHTDSAFSSGPLKTILRDLRRKNILVSGFNAGFCVLDTVTDAIDNKYKPWLIHDCIGQDQGHQLAIPRHIQNMKDAGARTVHSKDVRRALAL